MDDLKNSRVFVPFSDGLAERLAPLGELVPFELEYPCLRTTPSRALDQPTDDTTSPRVLAPTTTA